MSLVTIIGALIIICLLFWAARALLIAFKVGEPISTVIFVVLVVLVIVWLVGALGGGNLGSVGSLRIR